jgi:hypothetical protein
VSVRSHPSDVFSPVVHPPPGSTLWSMRSTPLATYAGSHEDNSCRKEKWGLDWNESFWREHRKELLREAEKQRLVRRAHSAATKGALSHEPGVQGTGGRARDCNGYTLAQGLEGRGKH